MLILSLFLYAEKDREIETSGVECRLNGHPLSRGIFYPKGSRAPGFVRGHQCVSVLETCPLWETFRSDPLFRTDARPLFLYGIGLTAVCR